MAGMKSAMVRVLAGKLGAGKFEMKSFTYLFLFP